MTEKYDKNCNNCKFGFFKTCETLKNNKEYQKITSFIEKFNFKNNFICNNYKSIYIEYPIEVISINQNTGEKSEYRNSDVGKFVRIAPCGKEYKGKTYLGIYIGELPIDNSISYNEKTKELNISFVTNPAIFVFDLNKIIYGYESWWSIIEKEEDLKEITCKDIENIWYVKALKSLL